MIGMRKFETFQNGLAYYVIDTWYLQFNSREDNLVFVESGQVDVEGVGEMRKIPILIDKSNTVWLS